MKKNIRNCNEDPEMNQYQQRRRENKEKMAKDADAVLVVGFSPEELEKYFKHGYGYLSGSDPYYLLVPSDSDAVSRFRGFIPVDNFVYCCSLQSTARCYIDARNVTDREVLMVESWLRANRHPTIILCGAQNDWAKEIVAMNKRWRPAYEKPPLDVIFYEI